jgi:primosomal protein N' (replication factor Y)
VLQDVEGALARGIYAPFVLFGSTGSGKTEVYLRAAEAALRAGRGVLYLVPEIGLTPLLVTRLAARFPGRVEVLHSGLAAGERRAAWERARAGACRFVVGTRSAVFAPLADLGLVVVDEEHDPSYKQGESPRYHGRDLAVLRARAAGAVVLLGSATPSLESFAHARSGRYGLLRLGGRVHARALAAVEIVDMRREFLQTRAAHPLSRALISALQECLSRREQALVLRNRRGWAVSLLCPACGTRVTCPRCSLALTWHQAAARLRCHLCDLERPHPGECPACRFEELQPLGEGAERIEHELREALPGARLARMDRDTVRRKGAQEDLLRRFGAGEIDVLVGTQMIAKGHDFPRVTLVGVVSADQSLGLPDFRAGERTFQLLTQVAGRAGRGELPGRVVVQAFDPEHPVLQEAARQDFEAFFAREMAYRRALRYPPLSALVQVIVSDRDPVQADAYAEEVGRALRTESRGRLLVSGPGPAPVERARLLWRRQIFVRSSGRRRLVAAVAAALADVEGKVPARALTVDVDPLSLL